MARLDRYIVAPYAQFALTPDILDVAGCNKTLNVVCTEAT
jgi:hypothetical protein